MSNVPKVNPVDRFGVIPEDRPALGAVIARSMATWTFQMYPQLWNDPALNLIDGLTWKTVAFEPEPTAENLEEIPEGPGVYMWIVRGCVDFLAEHTYIFYAGKAESGLRARYRNYVTERKETDVDHDRELIVKMLNYFTDRLCFSFVEAPKDKCSQIESAIKDNITPPANTILKLKGRIYRNEDD